MPRDSTPAIQAYAMVEPAEASPYCERCGVAISEMGTCLCIRLARVSWLRAQEWGWATNTLFTSMPHLPLHGQVCDLRAIVALGIHGPNIPGACTDKDLPLVDAAIRHATYRELAP